MFSWLKLGLITSVISICLGRPISSADIIRRAEITQDELLDSYDFIIVGGGQAGTVVASRLSEDPDVTVLVVEYGYFNNDPAHLQPAVRFQQQWLYNITFAPQRALNNRTNMTYAACCVGGGSTVNGMLLNRGSAADYNSWEALGNEGWGWDGLYPYFVKSSHFDAPSEAAVKEFNMTWGEESYGDGPIHQSFSSWQWPGIKIQRAGMIEAGAEPQVDGSGGNAFGTIWYPTALDNTTATRSYAVNGYYQPVSNRPNLHLLTGWHVDQLRFDKDKNAVGVSITKRNVTGQEEYTKAIVDVNLEIVVSAGAFHTPQILQRSGVGPSWLLEEAGVEVVEDLAGVGSNLQDHPTIVAGYNFTNNVLPNPVVSPSDPEFAAWAAKELAEHRSGPLRISTGNTGGLVPLPVANPDGYTDIVKDYLSQEPGAYLPETYTDEQVAGYEVLREQLAHLMSTPDNAWAEIPLTGSSTTSSVLMKCASRGTVLMNTTDIYAEPIVDYYTMVNPTDRKIMASNIRFVRRYYATEAMRQLGPIETIPGIEVQTDEEISAFISDRSGSTTGHNSGTAVMMPRELGGVVDAELKVYGIQRLSVADASIIPIIPAAHTCSTVYAIAEKAADIIKKRHGLRS